MKPAALIAALLALACASPSEEGPAAVWLVPGGDEVAAVEAPEGSVTARVEVAADPQARSRGLMHRRTLPPDTGMLFLYPRPEPRRFWMKSTRYFRAMQHAWRPTTRVRYAAQA